MFRSISNRSVFRGVGSLQKAMTSAMSTRRPLRIGDTVPDFEQNSTQGPIKFHDFIGDSWCILFSHPKAFTPICTTELGSMAQMYGEFQRRNVKVLSVSVDPVEDDLTWKADIEDVSGAAVSYPILSDGDRKVAELYNMLMENEEVVGLPITVRSVFVISPAKKLMLTLTYPPPVGRNFHEILRVVDALQLSTEHGLGTPANWKNGEAAIILPSVTDEQAAEKHPGFVAVKPYLRFTKDGVDIEKLRK